MFVDSLFSEVVTWPVAAHVEKQGFGAQGWRFSALARCRGRWGALEVERRLGGGGWSLGRKELAEAIWLSFAGSGSWRWRRLCVFVA
jgi:hypothetical protein